MLTITETAGAYLAEILKGEELPEDIAIRLVYEEEGLAMEPDNQRPGDTIFEYEGRLVLMLDEHVAQLLADETLDVDGTGLALRSALDEE